MLLSKSIESAGLSAKNIKSMVLEVLAGPKSYGFGTTSLLARKLLPSTSSLLLQEEERREAEEG